MTDTVEKLVIDPLEWVGRKQRTYQETMSAWRASCPRLRVSEEANDLGLVETGPANGRSLVRLTGASPAVLKERRPGRGDRIPTTSCGPFLSGSDGTKRNHVPLNSRAYD